VSCSGQTALEACSPRSTSTLVFFEGAGWGWWGDGAGREISRAHGQLPQGRLRCVLIDSAEGQAFTWHPSTAKKAQRTPSPVTWFPTSPSALRTYLPSAHAREKEREQTEMEGEG